jgi:hypothetical protein
MAENGYKYGRATSDSFVRSAVGGAVEGVFRDAVRDDGFERAPSREYAAGMKM